MNSLRKHIITFKHYVAGSHKMKYVKGLEQNQIMGCYCTLRVFIFNNLFIVVLYKCICLTN